VEVLLLKHLPQHPLILTLRMVKEIPTLALLAMLLFFLLMIVRMQRKQWVSLTWVQKMQLVIRSVATCMGSMHIIQLSTSTTMPQARRMQTEDHFAQKHAMATTAQPHCQPHCQLSHLINHMPRLLQMATNQQPLNVAVFMISTLKEVRSGGRQCMQQSDKRWS
jgi:hypothetical protein